MASAAPKPRPPARPTDGSRGFDAFLTANGISNVKASDDLGVSDPTIYEWRNGTKRPTRDHRDAIAVWTHGGVAVESWLLDGETPPADRVVPFERPSQAKLVETDDDDAEASGPHPSQGSFAPGEPTDPDLDTSHGEG